MGLSKWVSKLRRKSHTKQKTKQRHSEPLLRASSSSSLDIRRSASALDLRSSHSYPSNSAQSIMSTEEKSDNSTGQSGVAETTDSAQHSTTIQRGRFVQRNAPPPSLNLRSLTSALPEIPAPTRRPCSTPYDNNGHRRSRFYEHLHDDDAYEAPSRRSRSAPADMIRQRNSMQVDLSTKGESEQRWVFPKPTGIERKDSKHKRNQSFPVYP